MVVYTKTDEWHIEWHWMTMSDNEWQQVVQRMTTSDTTSDNEWYSKWQQITANDNEWQKMAISNSEWQRVIKRMNGQSASWIILFSFLCSIYNFYQNQPSADVFQNKFFLNFPIFTGKRLCSSHYLVKFQAWRPIDLLKRDSNTDIANF